MSKKKDDKTPNKLTLTVEEANVCAEYERQGFTPTQRRKYPVDVPFTDTQLAEFGDEVSAIDAELKVLRQGKNATSAALNREKKEKEGEMHSLAARIITRKDDFGKSLTVAERAVLARRQAQARKDFDEWEEQRKATIKSMADTLKEKEAGHAELSEKILNGKGKDFRVVIDLTDYASSTVVTVRVDTGEEVGRRALKDQERQQAMFTDIDGAESLNDAELKWGYSGQANKAVESYMKRTGLPEAKVKLIVKHMLGKDEELPEEEAHGGQSTDSKGSAQSSQDTEA